VLERESGLAARGFRAVSFAAVKAQVQHLLTFNPDHFTRVWPEGAEIVSVP